MSYDSYGAPTTVSTETDSNMDPAYDSPFRYTGQRISGPVGSDGQSLNYSIAYVPGDQVDIQWYLGIAQVGVVIQHIVGTLNDGTYENYSEAFPFSNGSIMSDRSMSGSSVDDEFNGWTSLTATATFYQGLTMNNLPGIWFTGDQWNQAGFLSIPISSGILMATVGAVTIPGYVATPSITRTIP